MPDKIDAAKRRRAMEKEMRRWAKHPETAPRALRDVWEWKDAISREVEHLPTREAVATILRNAEQTAKKSPWLFPASGANWASTENPGPTGRTGRRRASRQTR